jgi:hypothetical protein
MVLLARKLQLNLEIEEHGLSVGFVGSLEHELVEEVGSTVRVEHASEPLPVVLPDVWLQERHHCVVSGLYTVQNQEISSELKKNKRHIF